MCHGTVSSERQWQAEDYRCRLLRKYGRVENSTEQLQKIAAPHSMTSSVRASSDCGTVTPSARSNRVRSARSSKTWNPHRAEALSEIGWFQTF